MPEFLENRIEAVERILININSVQDCLIDVWDNINELKRKPAILNFHDYDKIKKLAIDGLCTDGGHHKQWYLEEILKALGHNLEVVRRGVNEEGYDWEEGIAP